MTKAFECLTCGDGCWHGIVVVLYVARKPKVNFQRKGGSDIRGSHLLK
jgi:hypothetical protein